MGALGGTEEGAHHLRMEAREAGDLAAVQMGVVEAHCQAGWVGERTADPWYPQAEVQSRGRLAQGRAEAGVGVVAVALHLLWVAFALAHPPPRPGPSPAAWPGSASPEFLSSR